MELELIENLQVLIVSSPWFSLAILGGIHYFIHAKPKNIIIYTFIEFIAGSIISILMYIFRLNSLVIGSTIGGVFFSAIFKIYNLKKNKEDIPFMSISKHKDIYKLAYWASIIIGIFGIMLILFPMGFYIITPNYFDKILFYNNKVKIFIVLEYILIGSFITLFQLKIIKKMSLKIKSK